MIYCMSVALLRLEVLCPFSALHIFLDAFQCATQGSRNPMTRGTFMTRLRLGNVQEVVLF